MLYSPESSRETDADPAAAVEGAESSELYQTEDGKHDEEFKPCSQLCWAALFGVFFYCQMLHRCCKMSM